MSIVRHYIKFRAVIFDLDLTLWDGRALYRDALDIIKFCVDQRVKLFIVSFNKNAIEICHDLLKIGIYFNLICYVEPHDTKANAINILIRDFNLSRPTIIFYDDDLRNVYSVYKTVNICCIHAKTGITWGHIPILKELIDDESPRYNANYNSNLNQSPYYNANYTRQKERKHRRIPAIEILATIPE